MDVLGTGTRCSLHVTTMAVAGIAGVAVVVAADSAAIVVGAAKNVVAVKDEVAPIAPPLTRHAP